MNPELARELNALFDAAAQSRPSSPEFEVAYQSRVVMDRIRFAIRVTDQSPPKPDQLREAGIQLLDALDRLDRIDRGFQTRLKAAERFLNGSVPIVGEPR
jgi:hypothetical protein